MTDTERGQLLFADAFAEEPLAGTPTVLLPEGDELSGEQARAVAGECGDRVAAVVGEPVGTGGADRRLRLVGPAGPRDRADHATVAALAVLHARGAVDAGSCTLETPGGPRGVEIDDRGRAWVAQPDATVESTDVRGDLRRAAVADALGVPEAAIEAMAETLPLAVAETVRPYLVVPVNYLQRLGEAEPDRAALADCCAAVGAAGVCAFTFDTVDGNALHARLFVPDGAEGADGAVPPRPAGGVEALPDGSGAGAVAAYLRAYGAFDDDGPTLASDGGVPDGGEEPTEHAGSGEAEDDGDGADDGGESAFEVESVTDLGEELGELADTAAGAGAGDAGGVRAPDADLAGVTAAGADVEIDVGLPDELAVEAGYFLDRPGLVHVRTGTGIQIGGRAAVSMEGTVAIPTDADDDIRVA